MADIDLPEDLIDLRRRFEEAEAVVARLAGPEPGEGLPSWDEAIKAQQELAVKIHRHRFWGSIPAGERFAARMELLKAARGAPSDA